MMEAASNDRPVIDFSAAGGYRSVATPCGAELDGDPLGGERGRSRQHRHDRIQKLPDARDRFAVARAFHARRGRGFERDRDPELPERGVPFERASRTAFASSSRPSRASWRALAANNRA